MKAILQLVPMLTLAFASAGCTTYFATPTSATTTPAPTADLSTFASQVARGGFASRSFTLAAAGTIQITLTSVAPSVVVGLGVGIPRSDGAGCNVSRSIETSAGTSPQVSISADAGDYCVKVFDVGHIETFASFAVTITRP